MSPGFGCRHEADVRDSQFLLRALMPETRDPLPVRKSWGINAKALDQGRTGTCVGHAWRGFLRCAPIRTEKGSPSQWDIYRAAVLKDGYPDNDDESNLPDGDEGMDSGTSVRAGVKALVDAGRVASYHWAFRAQQASDWLRSSGPLVLGIPWTTSMMTPDNEGIIRYQPASGLAGRHAILARTVEMRRSLIGLANSWGDGWGISGNCFLPLEDLEEMFRDNAEACAAIEKKPN